MKFIISLLVALSIFSFETNAKSKRNDSGYVNISVPTSVQKNQNIEKEQLNAAQIFEKQLLEKREKNKLKKKLEKEKKSKRYSDPKDVECKEHCGRGYFYDRPGSKNNGQEIVCTKYPLSCGYNCTYSWSIKYLVNGTNYTCQKARQNPNFSRN